MKNDPVSTAIIMSDLVIREMATNKLSLIGTFNAWNFPHFPHQTPPFWITSTIANILTGGEELSVVVRVEDPRTGSVVFSGAAKVVLNNGPVPPGALLEAPFPVPSVTFHTPGRYLINLLVNSESIGQRTFEVFQVKHPPQPQLGA